MLLTRIREVLLYDIMTLWLMVAMAVWECNSIVVRQHHNVIVWHCDRRVWQCNSCSSSLLNWMGRITWDHETATQTWTRVPHWTSTTHAWCATREAASLFLFRKQFPHTQMLVVTISRVVVVIWVVLYIGKIFTALLSYKTWSRRLPCILWHFAVAYAIGSRKVQTECC